MLLMALTRLKECMQISNMDDKKYWWKQNTIPIKNDNEGTKIQELDRALAEALFWGFAEFEMEGTNSSKGGTKESSNSRSDGAGLGLTGHQGSPSKSVQDQHQLQNPISNREDWLKLRVGIGSYYSGEPKKTGSSSHNLHDIKKGKGIWKSNVHDGIGSQYSGAPNRIYSYAADYDINKVKGRSGFNINDREDRLKRRTLDYSSYSAKSVTNNETYSINSSRDGAGLGGTDHRGSQSKSVRGEQKLHDLIPHFDDDRLKLTLGIDSHFSGPKKSNNTDKGKVTWKFDDVEKDWLTLGIGSHYSGSPKKSRSHIAHDINEAKGKQRSIIDNKEDLLKPSALDYSSYSAKPVTNEDNTTFALNMNNSKCDQMESTGSSCTGEINYGSRSSLRTVADDGAMDIEVSSKGNHGSLLTIADDVSPNSGAMDINGGSSNSNSGYKKGLRSKRMKCKRFPSQRLIFKAIPTDELKKLSTSTDAATDETENINKIGW
ncbi:hypothetical protein Sjap_018990 [Stephania japonica]|uniref:Uncharacterized protein n=1 Tax=Stephania japonica TaxID=461633 RepID=A0AAP0EXW6_9MAGN